MTDLLKNADVKKLFPPIQGIFKIRKDKYIITVGDVLHFSFIKTKDSKTLNYEYSLQPDKASSIGEIINVCALCRGLLSGKILQDDKVIFEYEPNDKVNRDRKSITYLEAYWKKIYELEKLFNRKFSPAEIVNNYDKEHFTFLRLVRCLLEKKPYRIDDFSLSELTLETTSETLIKRIQSQKTSNFVFNEETSLVFANQELPLHKIRCLFKVAADNVDIIDKNNGTKKVIVTVDNNNDDMYLVEQLFLNEDDTAPSKVGDKLQQMAEAKPL